MQIVPQGMQEVSRYKHSFFFCIYSKRLHFSFSSHFLRWLVKVVLSPRHPPAASGLDTRSCSCLEATFPLVGKRQQKWQSFNTKVTVTSSVAIWDLGSTTTLGSSEQSIQPSLPKGSFLSWASEQQQQPRHVGSSSRASTEVSLSLSAAFRSLQWSSSTAASPT